MIISAAARSGVAGLRRINRQTFTAPNSQNYTDLVFHPTGCVSDLCLPHSQHQGFSVFIFDLPATEANGASPFAVQYSTTCRGCAPGIDDYSPQNLQFVAVNGSSSVIVSGSRPAEERSARDTLAPDTVEGALIQEITCGAALPGRTTTLFGPDRNFSAGWSHINDPTKAADFTGLQQPLSAYSISSNNLSIDASCEGEKTYSALLVKKLHTWNNTHANGLETNIDGRAIAEIESLIVELKLNSARSLIPSAQQIRAVYPRLTRKQLRNLDRGMANIDLVFSAGKLRSNKILSIDPNKYADKWLRITIPMESMNYYQEVDYKRTYSPHQAAKNQRFTSLIINAESRYRKTVQHLQDDKAGAVQLFKELDISIYRIAYVMKGPASSRSEGKSIGLQSSPE